MSFIKKIIEQKYTVILGLVGFVLVLLSFYTISGKISDLIVSLLPSPNFYLLTLGALTILGSIVVAILQENLLDWALFRKIRKTNSGFEALFKTAKIYIHFGLLQEEIKLGDTKTAVVLPANDLFDDGCFDDTGIALGGYLAHHFNHSEIGELKEQRTQELCGLPAESIEDGFTNADKSYGVGTCLFLEKSGHRLIIAAVSTKRKREGIKAEIYYLHRAMHEVLKTVGHLE